jgi:hypothetical protein
MWFLKLSFHKHHVLQNIKVSVGKKYATVGICGWSICGTWKQRTPFMSAFIMDNSDIDFFWN